MKQWFTMATITNNIRNSSINTNKIQNNRLNIGSSNTSFPNGIREMFGDIFIAYLTYIGVIHNIIWCYHTSHDMHRNRFPKSTKSAIIFETNTAKWWHTWLKKTMNSDQFTNSLDFGIYTNLNAKFQCSCCCRCRCVCVCFSCCLVLSAFFTFLWFSFILFVWCECVLAVHLFDLVQFKPNFSFHLFRNIE